MLDPDCNGCVYDSLSDCELCIDCGDNSKNRVEFPHANYSAENKLLRESLGKAATRYEAAEASLEEANQKLLSHAQNKHPHEYEELVEVLQRESKLKEQVDGLTKENDQLKLMIPALPCCPDGFMDEPCSALINAARVANAARRWRKPAHSYDERERLDAELTAAVDSVDPKKQKEAVPE